MRRQGKKYLQGQPERHRAILEALRARYEGEAAKFDGRRTERSLG